MYRARVKRAALQRRLVGELADRAFAGSTSQLILRALSSGRATPEELEDDPRARHASDVAALVALPTLALATLAMQGLGAAPTGNGLHGAGITPSGVLGRGAPPWSQGVAWAWLAGVGLMSTRSLVVRGSWSRRLRRAVGAGPRAAATADTRPSGLDRGTTARCGRRRAC